VFNEIIDFSPSRPKLYTDTSKTNSGVAITDNDNKQSELDHELKKNRIRNRAAATKIGLE